MKKAIVCLLTMIMMLSGIWLLGTEGREVLAAEGDVTAGDGYIAVEYNDLTTYRTADGNVAPTAPTGYENYIFAGWYTTSACESVYAGVSASTTLAYAKFVPQEVLSVRCQLKGDASTSDTTNMRLVSSVDGLKYKDVGYEIYYNGAETPVTVTTDTVYERIVASTASGVDYKYSPKVVDVESEYFVTATLLNIKKDNFGNVFYIKPYWTTLDGTVVYGMSKYVTVNNGLSTANINIPVKVAKELSNDTLAVTVAGTTYPATAAYYDGTYAHLNIEVENRDTVLKSLSTVTVTDGTTTSLPIYYRNLMTAYTGDDTADTSWYDVKGANAKKYVIATSADLYGLANLLNAPTYYFGGQTIYMVADIEVNKGRATESGWSTYEEDGTTAIEGATSYVWTPIAYTGSPRFAGTFDGQQHEISGLNSEMSNTAEAWVGLFGFVTGTVQNVRLTNSYFAGTKAGTANMNVGSIAGRCDGYLDSVYSDAIVKNNSPYTGGMVGFASSTTAKTIKNCWYDGTMILDGDNATYGGGMVGYQFKGTMEMSDCLFSGKINFTNRTVDKEVCVGGLCGRSATSITIKNSLSAGEVSLVDSSVSLSALGRVIGLITNSTSITVKVENVYYVNLGLGTLAWSKGANPVIEGTPVNVAKSDITGNCAYFNNILDYTDDSAWALVVEETSGVDSTPILKAFADVVPEVPVVPDNADISWYEGIQDSYIICDNTDNALNVKELNGFAFMCTKGMSFVGKTVYLGNDVAVNEETISELSEDEYANLDAWTPIGTTTREFAGTFDGGMNSISGIYVNTSEQGAALFKNTAVGSTIENLKLENSYINTTAERAGSIVASLGGNLTNVYSSAIVNSSAGFAGGLVGQVFSSGDVGITNCWFDGSVSANSNAGGIVGIITSGTITTQNCLNSGSITIPTNKDTAGGLIGRVGTSSVEWGYSGSSSVSLTIQTSLNAGDITGRNNIGSAIGWPQKGTLTLENVYATKTSNGASVDNVGIGSLKDDTRVTMVDLDDITGLCSHYNNILVNAEEWVPTETTPALKVFTDGLLTESTADINIDWFTGFDTIEYTICDEDTNEANVAELNGFAYLANHGIDFEGMTVTLANDVTLNEETIRELTEEQRAELEVWTPIGSPANKFAGTFNGDMHTIYGLYISSDEVGAALFSGTSATSTIKNLKLKNAYITTTANYAGSFVGSTSGNLTNLYSNADIVSTKAYTGGIVGQTWTDAENDITISGCWFDGTIDAPANIGGIVAIGSKGNFELKDCLNTGDITYSTDAENPSLKWVGGLVGRTLRSDTEWKITENKTATMSFKMTNCLNAGKLTDSNDKRVGSVLGQNNGPSVEFTNVYTTEESYKYDGVSTSVGRNTSGGAVNYGGIILAAESDITAEIAYYNKVLVDVANTAWSLTTETPVLTVFISEANAITAPVIEDTVDISWYDGLKAIAHEVCTSEDNTENVKQFYGFAYLVNHGVDFDNMTVKMANSVTVNESAVTTWNLSTKEGLTLWTPIGTDLLEFAGIFDGQMNSISGILVQTDVQGAGLFRNTADGSALKNLKLVNSYIDATMTSGSAMAGSVVGSCGGDLINVYSNAFVRAGRAYIGGLAGQFFGSGEMSIDGCCFDGTILNKTGSSNAGGIVGLVTSGTITMTDCLNSGNITIAGDSAGGFFGRSFTAADGWTLAGTGSATLTIRNCLNTGNIKGNDSIGSVIGWKQRGTVNIGEAVYGTKTSTETDETEGVNNQWIGNGSVNDGEATLVETAEIKGALAQNALTGLDFSETGKWALISGDTPQLRAFADEAKLLAGDFSWYTADADEYIIDTADELIGFSSLASYGTTYSGKTIKLGANIDLNEDWTVSTNAEAPEVEWNPVGTTIAPFAGTFDGQGYSISGVYVASADDYIGLFGVTGESSAVKNLRLLNSYFEQQVAPLSDEDELDGYVGSIAGWLKGDMDNVYSNAIVASENRYTGGLVSWVRRSDLSEPVNITNCWFDGQIITGTYGRYIGGIAAGILNGTCNMENVLFTGKIDACYNGEKAIYLGGIVGEVKAIAQALNLTSVVSAGKIVGNHTSIQCNAVVGRVRIADIYNNNTVNASAANPQLNMENVFATRDCYGSPYGYDGTVYTGTKVITEAVTDDEGNIVTPAVTEEITAKVTVTGTVARTNGDDRLLGYIPNKTIQSDKENPVVSSLDFAEAWVMRTDGVPIPATLQDVVTGKISSVDAEALAKEIGLDYWNTEATITDVEDYGAGNYLVKYTPTTDLTYAGYLAKLVDLGFTKYADNSSSDMDDDGVHQATYKKDSPEWILNVTWVENESQIYISINTDKSSLDDNLVGATQERSDAISLSMLEITNTEDDQYGNSFVFELPNGHFIVSDGGRVEDGLKLIDYMKELAGTTDGVQNPIYIDAWIITHYHGDHCGALAMFNDYPAYRENVYVDAIYVSEPSSYAADYWETDRVAVMNNVYKGISYLTKTDKVTRPNIYQMHMGQRYYFNGITMDVIDTQEQHPVASWADTNGKLPDPFNTSSTSCIFSFADGNGATKKTFIGGDATNVNLEYMMMAYGESNKTFADIDVFVALHHGHNTTATYGPQTVALVIDVNGVATEKWADFLLDNNTDQKFDAVLFPYYKIYELTWVEGKGYVDHIDTKAYPYNIGDMNRYLYENGKAAMYYTYGYGDMTDATEDAPHGTVKLTFGTTIEATVLDSWK